MVVFNGQRNAHNFFFIKRGKRASHERQSERERIERESFFLHYIKIIYSDSINH